ncbi:MAG: hypothetical protein D6831_00955 [Aquificota bacterium]|nr:MAG: hypothetical protein D6831_00955 [Aquificota bacterium]
MLETADIAKVIAALIITVFIILSIYYGIVRYGKPVLSKKGDIKIKDIKYLGKGKVIVLLEVKEKEFLLAFGEKEIAVVDKWEKNKPDNSKNGV